MANDGRNARSAGERRWVATVTLAVIAVLVAVLGGAYAAWRLSARAAYEAAHPERAVSVSVTAAGYSPSEEGPAALRVEGTTADGRQVSGYALVELDPCSLMLEPGSYAIGVAGSVIGSDGTLYRASADSLKIEVPDSGATTPIGFELAVADPGGVTATDVYEAYDALLRAGAGGETSRELRAAADDRYQTAEKNEEPEAQEVGDRGDQSQEVEPQDTRQQVVEPQETQSQVVGTQGTQPQAPAFPFTPTADSVPLQGADEQAFVLKCAQALGVPTDQSGITYQLTEQYYWEGGALDLLTIVFRGQDGYQASGECTVEDGPIKGIAGWSSTEL